MSRHVLPHVDKSFKPLESHRKWVLMNFYLQLYLGPVRSVTKSQSKYLKLYDGVKIQYTSV